MTAVAAFRRSGGAIDLRGQPSLQAAAPTWRSDSNRSQVAPGLRLKVVGPSHQSQTRLQDRNVTAAKSPACSSRSTASDADRSSDRKAILPTRAELIKKLGQPKQGCMASLCSPQRRASLAAYDRLLDHLSDFHGIFEAPHDSPSGALRPGTSHDSVVSAARATLRSMRADLDRCRPAFARARQLALNELANSIELQESDLAEREQLLGAARLQTRDTTAMAPEPAVARCAQTSRVVGEEPWPLDPSQLRASDRRLFELNGVPVNPRTTEALHYRQDSKAELMRFGDQGTSSVFKGSMRDRRGEEHTIIFKLLPWSGSGPAKTADDLRGLRANTCFVIANLVAWDLAQALGFDVVVRTAVGIGRVASGPCLGVAMAEAEGGSPARAAVIDSGELRRELTKLQVLDYILNYPDRRGRNYRINVIADGGVRVTAFDNDECLLIFETAATALAKRGFIPRPMRPTVLDSDMAQALERFSAERLEDILTQFPLDAEVVRDARARLSRLHDHVLFLRREELVIEPGEWMAPKVTDALRQGRCELALLLREQLATDVLKRQAAEAITPPPRHTSPS